jgi:hypothetical protein
MGMGEFHHPHRRIADQHERSVVGANHGTVVNMTGPTLDGRTYTIAAIGLDNHCTPLVTDARAIRQFLVSSRPRLFTRFVNLISVISCTMLLLIIKRLNKRPRD